MFSVKNPLKCLQKILNEWKISNKLKILYRFKIGLRVLCEQVYSDTTFQQLLDNTGDKQHEEQVHQKDQQVVQDEPS